MIERLRLQDFVDHPMLAHPIFVCEDLQGNLTLLDISTYLDNQQLPVVYPLWSP